MAYERHGYRARMLPRATTVLPTSFLTRVAASALGGALARAVKVVDAVRPARRPIHSRGEGWHATLRVAGAGEGPRTGVAWLDEPSGEEVLVRFSTSFGLPGWLPDIQGVALRVPQPEGFADLLLASTGTGRVGRFVLRPARARSGAPYTTLLPYRGPRGPLLLGLREHTPGRLELSWATPAGAWHPVGELVLHRRTCPDVRFDPVLATPPGLVQYDWVVRVREPAYRTARG